MSTSPLARETQENPGRSRENWDRSNAKTLAKVIVCAQFSTGSKAFLIPSLSCKNDIRKSFILLAKNNIAAVMLDHCIALSGKVVDHLCVLLAN